MDSGYPVFQNSLTPLGFHTETNYPADTAFVIGAGAAGEVGYSSVDYWGADDCYSICPSEKVLSKYVYHFLLTKQGVLKANVRKASIPRLARNVIEKLSIPVPPLEEQQRIVDVLDRFDALTTSISEGLPAEIEARRQQYEYYRDKLLSFPRKDVA